MFRTLLNDCRSLVLPVLNEIFGEEYTGTERIVFSLNEHFLNRQDGNEDKRVTDSSFTVYGKTEKKYLFECQSTADSSLLVRIYEYAVQIALDDGELSENRLKVTIPHSAILFLRSTHATPDSMLIVMETPGGTVEFPVPVMKMQSYTLQEIMEKDLLFLIPFYIFIHEKQLKAYENDATRLDELKEEYRQIAGWLEQKAERGQISVFTSKTLIDMTGKVLDNIAARYEKIREGVRTVMGGKILEYEAKTILRAGFQEGQQESLTYIILNMKKKGYSVAQIADATDKKPEEVLAILEDKQQEASI